jgi:hypothetical protein
LIQLFPIMPMCKCGLSAFAFWLQSLASEVYDHADLANPPLTPCTQCSKKCYPYSGDTGWLSGCCFLVENCTLAKNENIYVIFVQKQHIFFYENVFLKKGHDQKMVFFGFSILFWIQNHFRNVWDKNFCGWFSNSHSVRPQCQRQESDTLKCAPVEEEECHCAVEGWSFSIPTGCAISPYTLFETDVALSFIVQFSYNQFQWIFQVILYLLGCSVCVLSFIVRRFALQFKNVTGQSRMEIHLVRIVIKIKKALHVAYHLFITVRQVSLFTVRGERPLQRHVQLAWRLGGLRLLAILDMHSRPQCR